MNWDLLSRPGTRGEPRRAERDGLVSNQQPLQCKVQNPTSTESPKENTLRVLDDEINILSNENQQHLPLSGKITTMQGPGRQCNRDGATGPGNLQFGLRHPAEASLCSTAIASKNT